MANSSSRQIASVDRYANALFQLAKEAKVLETVSSELLNLKKILNEDDTLLSMVKNPSVSKSNKFNFFNTLSEKIEMSKLAKNFIGVIINKNRINYLMDIINSFEKLMAGLKGEMSATITSAKILKEEELDFFVLNFHESYCLTQIIFFKKFTVLLKQCHNQVINS